MSDAITLAREYRERLRQMELARQERMLQAWRDIERRLSRLAELVAIRISTGHLAVTPSLALEDERLRELIAAAQVEADRFAAMASRQIAIDQATAVEMAHTGAQLSLQLAGSFKRIPKEAVAAFVHWTGTPTAPLVKLFQESFGQATDAMLLALASAIGAGRGPAEVANEMMHGFGVGFDRALRISRTEVLRAYRKGTQESYQASGMVTTYKRLATHDDRVCLGCLFMEGESFPTTRDFDEHPNGRCMLVPIVIDAPEPRWLAGEEWFLRQPEARQRLILGEARWELWSRGEVRNLREFVLYNYNQEWGGAFVPKPIRELRRAA